MRNVQKISLLILLGIVLLFGHSEGFAGRDDGFVQDYPGGDYGLDLGGGYESMPDGTLLTPSAYRDDYVSTKYGPMTHEGFVIFPGYDFADTRAQKAQKMLIEKQRQRKEQIFHNAFEKDESGSSLWGFSDSSKEK
ncbi:MAG: hypothetical protein PHW46_01515 [Candidatus Omnitrophica bacterium]|nr:hypothetical protein [Candidatus Omnitrophota bacterium]